MSDSWSYPDFVAMRDGSTSFSGIYAYAPISARVALDSEPTQIRGEIVSGSYFDVLGVVPVRGRGFLSDEDLTPGTHPVAVISYGLWQRLLGGAEDAVGRTVLLNEVAFHDRRRRAGRLPERIARVVERSLGADDNAEGDAAAVCRCTAGARDR